MVSSSSEFYNHEDHDKLESLIEEAEEIQDIAGDHSDIDLMMDIIIEDEEQIQVHHNHEDEYKDLHPEDDVIGASVDPPPTPNSSDNNISSTYYDDEDAILQSTIAPTTVSSSNVTTINKNDTAITNSNDSFHQTDTINDTTNWVPLVGILMFLIHMLVLYGILRYCTKKQRAQKAKEKIYNYLVRFDADEVDLVKAQTGGWHGSYQNKLLSKAVERYPYYVNNNNKNNITDRDDSDTSRNTSFNDYGDLDVESNSFKSHPSALLNDTIWSDRGSYHMRTTKSYGDDDDDDDNDSYNGSFSIGSIGSVEDNIDHHDDYDDDDDNDHGDKWFASLKKSLIGSKKSDSGGDNDNITKEDFKQKLSIGI